MPSSTESFDDLPLSDLRRVVSVLVGQVERLQADVLAQSRIIEDQSLMIEGNPSVGAALPVSFWSVQLSFWR
jgi:hypothetical protein